METFAALRLEINSWRWKGVPFYIRGGKCLPVTCTEIVVRLRISPDITIAIGANVIAPGQGTVSESAEIFATGHSRADEMDAYERVLKAGAPVYEYEPGTWGPKEIDLCVTPPGGRQNPMGTS